MSNTITAAVKAFFEKNKSPKQAEIQELFNDYAPQLVIKRAKGGFHIKDKSKCCHVDMKGCSKLSEMDEKYLTEAILKSMPKKEELVKKVAEYKEILNEEKQKIESFLENPLASFDYPPQNTVLYYKELFEMIKETEKLIENIED